MSRRQINYWNIAAVRMTAAVLLALVVSVSFGSLPRHAFADTKSSAKPAPTLPAAIEARQRGRYEEAQELITELLAADPADRAIRLEEVELGLQTGQADKTFKSLRGLTEGGANEARPWGLQALAEIERGNFAAAASSVKEALSRDQADVSARLASARLAYERGEIEEAISAYRWFVKYYNRVQPTDAITLLVVAEGASQYARLKHVTQIFDFTVNTLCPDALKADPLCWEAHVLAGLLFLEKYNEGDARREFDAALATNPNAAIALAGSAALQARGGNWAMATTLAEKALEINRYCQLAWQVKLEVTVAQGNPEKVSAILMECAPLFPGNQRWVARLLADEWRKTRVPSAAEAMEALQIDALKKSGTSACREAVTLLERNVAPGEFYCELAAAFEPTRQTALVEALYTKGTEIAPQLSAPRVALAMQLMQQGKLNEARHWLDEAFKADPYHVRVSNMRKVVKVLDSYETITTDHFVIRYDKAEDGLLIKLLVPYLEETYEQLAILYQYEPPTRTTVEIFNKTKGLGGHQWFSARMIGLPWIQTIGASTGYIIALTSPNGIESPYDWGRVLRHELVHVFTLQQTEFRIPHWFTEALAVRSEGIARPDSWNRLLCERVPKRNLRRLDQLTEGFTRAQNADDWTFAYCQSALYADYFIERFGADALDKLLAAYRTGQTTSQAMTSCYGVTIDDVEAGYVQFLDKVVAPMLAAGPADPSAGGSKSGSGADFAALEAAARKESADEATLAEYALSLVGRKRFDDAQAAASRLLETAPKNMTAAIVMALVLEQKDQTATAIQRLSDAVREGSFHSEALLLLAQLYIKSKDEVAAARVLRQGVAQAASTPLDQRQPFAERLASLARKKPEIATPAERIAWLQILAIQKVDSAELQLEVAGLLLEIGDAAGAAKAAQKALFIDVQSADAHRLLAESRLKLGDSAAAVAAARLAIETPEYGVLEQLTLTECLIANQNMTEAGEVLDAILKQNAKHSEALRLKATLPTATAP